MLTSLKKRTGSVQAIQFRQLKLLEAFDFDLCNSHSRQSNCPECHRRAYQEINHPNLRAVWLVCNKQGTWPLI